MPTISRATLSLLTISALASVVPATPSHAYTPWGMIARRAIGRVEQMSKPPEGEQPGIDVATVVLNADAGKVYATVVRLLHRNQQVQVTSEAAERRTVAFSSGARSASISVTDLGSRLSQIVVASAIKPGGDSATLKIVDGIMRVCREMKVTCSER